MTNAHDRRDFLKSAAGAVGVASATSGWTAESYARVVGANDRIRVGLIGVDHLIRGYRATMRFSGSKWIAEDKDGKVLAEKEGDVSESIHKHHSNLHSHRRDGEPLSCAVDLGLAGVAAVCMANESWRTGQMGWDKQRQRMAPAASLGERDHFASDPPSAN